MKASPLHVRPPTPREFGLTLSAWEGQFVEFKEAISDALPREIAAFANSGGGRIYVGVADDRSLKGVTIANRLLSQVQDMARQCDPPVAVAVVPFRYQRTDLLMIDVREGDRKPYGCSAGYFLRSGPSSQKLRRDELVEFVRTVVPVEFDRAECPGFRYPRDFDRGAFQDFLRRSHVRVAGMKPPEILINLGVARAEGPALRLNNAGVLMFAKDPCRFFPQSEVTCVLYRDVEGTKVLDRKDLRGALLANLEDAIVFFTKHIAVRYEIKGLYRKEIPEIPEDALREAVVNALMHRDYHVAGARVMVVLFPDRVEISDPGGLPPGLAPRQFGTVSVRRNHLIADLLHRAGFVERIGSGIRRMRAAMRAAGLADPEFDFGGFFIAMFRKHQAIEAGSESEPRQAQVTGQVGAQEAQVEVQVALTAIERGLLDACANAARSGHELTAVAGYDGRTGNFKRSLKRLIEQGLLALTRPDKPRSRFQKYVTTPAGRAQLGKPA